jgi:hypothetical protein
MITVIRTATSFPGMTGEAITWAKEVAVFVKRVTGKEQFVCTSFGGMLADIARIGHYDSVGQYDEMRTKVVSDGEPLQRIASEQQNHCSTEPPTPFATKSTHVGHRLTMVRRAIRRREPSLA